MPIKKPMDLKIPNSERDMNLTTFVALLENVQRNHNELLDILPDSFPDNQDNPAVVFLTQSEYDSIVPDEWTLYFIEEE